MKEKILFWLWVVIAIGFLPLAVKALAEVKMSASVPVNSCNVCISECNKLCK